MQFDEPENTDSNNKLAASASNRRTSTKKMSIEIDDISQENMDPNMSENDEETKAT